MSMRARTYIHTSRPAALEEHGEETERCRVRLLVCGRRAHSPLVPFSDLLRARSSPAHTRIHTHSTRLQTRIADVVGFVREAARVLLELDQLEPHLGTLTYGGGDAHSRTDHTATHLTQQLAIVRIGVQRVEKSTQRLSKQTAHCHVTTHCTYDHNNTHRNARGRSVRTDSRPLP
jgi:hypothetical protein